MTMRSRFRARRRGSMVVETAVVLPIYLMVLLGIFEYGRFLMVRNLVDNAARVAARYAVVNVYGATTSQIQAVATNALAGQGGQLSGLTISVYEANPTTGAYQDVWTNASFGSSVMVQITGTYTPALPKLLLMNSSITVTGQSMMQCEAN